MRKRPMISIAAATGLLDAIKAAGGGPDRILRPLGLDPAVFSNSEGFVPWAAFARILEEASRVTGDDCFGLHFGERYDPKNIGPLAYVVLNAPTIAVAVQDAGRYLHVHNEAANLWYAVEGDRVSVRYALADVGIEAPRQHNEYSMAVVLNTMRLMVGSQWTPLEVQFPHAAPSSTLEHTRFFRAPILFGCATNAFVAERDLAERPVPAADRRLYPILKRYLDRVLEEMPREDGLLHSVRRAVAESMRDGDPKLARVAKKVAMSPRTLQRQLKDYGMDFKDLVEDTRRRFSLNYLRDPKQTLTEVAYLLGYSELSAFNRAFKRWMGSTPLDYRRHGPKLQAR